MRAKIVRHARLGVVPLCVAFAGCFHESRAWPLALDPGSMVVVSFAQPRAVGVGNDSLLVVTGLSGHVRALRTDTIVVGLTKVAGDVTHDAWAGRTATFTLDSSTTVVRSEFDKGSIPLVIIAAAVAFYAFIGSLPP